MVHCDWRCVFTAHCDMHPCNSLSFCHVNCNDCQPVTEQRFMCSLHTHTSLVLNKVMFFSLCQTLKNKTHNIFLFIEMNPEFYCFQSRTKSKKQIQMQIFSKQIQTCKCPQSITHSDLIIKLKIRIMHMSPYVTLIKPFFLIICSWPEWDISHILNIQT